MIQSANSKEIPENKNWIRDFAQASFKLYSGNTVDAFQPLDFFHFYPLWYDLWVNIFMSVMDVLQCDYKSYQELKHLLPVPSSMRAILQKLIPTFAGMDPIHAKNFGRMANFSRVCLKKAVWKTRLVLITALFIPEMN
jgi:hypothetical protein